MNVHTKSYKEQSRMAGINTLLQAFKLNCIITKTEDDIEHRCMSEIMKLDQPTTDETTCVQQHIHQRIAQRKL